MENFVASWTSVKSGRVYASSFIPCTNPYWDAAAGHSSRPASLMRALATFYSMALHSISWQNPSSVCSVVDNSSFSIWEVSLNLFSCSCCLSLFIYLLKGGIASNLVSMGYSNVVEKRDKGSMGASGMALVEYTSSDPPSDATASKLPFTLLFLSLHA